VDCVPAGDRSHLTGAEHPRDRAAQEPVNDAGVMAGIAEHLGPPPVAGEHESSRRLVAGEEERQVLARGGRIAYLELDDGTDGHLGRDGQRTGIAIGPQQAADEEVSPAEVQCLLVDDDTTQQSLGGAVAGMFCAGEVGPVAGRNAIHGFTASIALFHD